MKSKIKSRKIQSKLNKLKNKNINTYNDICNNVGIVYDNAYIKSHKTYGFIYITINNQNGKCYIGRRIAYNGNKPHHWEKYLGSGKILKRAVAKYGKRKFTRIIIDIANNFEELNNKEIYWISKFHADESDCFYNLSKGGEANSDGSKMCHPIYCITNNKFYLSCLIASEDTGDEFKKIRNRCMLNNKNVICRYREIGELPEIRVDRNGDKLKNDYCYIEYAHIFIFNNKAINGCNICYDFKNDVLYRSPKSILGGKKKVMSKEKYSNYFYFSKKFKNNIVRVKDYLIFNKTLDISKTTIFNPPNSNWNV